MKARHLGTGGRQSPRPGGRRVAETPVRWNPRVLIPVGIFVLVSWVSRQVLTGSVYQGFGIVILGWLGLKLFLAGLPIRKRKDVNRLRFGVVVTSYNENPAAIRACLESLYHQTVRPVKIVFTDDHSRSRIGVRTVQAWAKSHPDIPVVAHRQPRNMGKREGLAYGFREMSPDDVDVYFCIDSDTFISPGALEAACYTFSNRRVVAATGACLASNAKKNALTLVENLRYANAFFGERQALSTIGSVLCVSGAVAFWRSGPVHLVLDEFLGQTIFGKKTSVGDDRHLTNQLLPYGRIEFIPDAIAYTDVPDNLKQYRKQQIRWGRSFWLESVWLLKGLRLDKPYWWLCLGDLFFGAAAAVNLLWLITDLAITRQFHVVEYAWLSFLWAYARSAYILAAPRRVISLWMALGSFSLSGLNTILSTFMVIPLRIWSAVTVHKVGWMTRANQGPETGAVPLHLTHDAAARADKTSTVA